MMQIELRDDIITLVDNLILRYEKQTGKCSTRAEMIGTSIVISSEMVFG